MTEPKKPWEIRGAYALSDMTEPVVVICKRCDRRGRYNVERLRVAHGDVPMPHLLTILAKDDCQGRDAWGGCGLVYENPMAGRAAPVPAADQPLPAGRMSIGQALAGAIKPR